MTDVDDHDEQRDDPVAEALGSLDAARHVAHLTGMSLEAAQAYAAFHSGRWAVGPAERRGR
jgi:hypothetical protein